MPRKKKSTVKSRIAPVGKVRTASPARRQKQIQKGLIRHKYGPFTGEGDTSERAKRRHQAMAGAADNPAIRNENKRIAAKNKAAKKAKKK